MSTFKMRLVSILILVSLLVIPPIASVKAAPTVYRVTPTGLTSGNCGGSWTSPCNLQYALSLAVAGDQLWVAAGTYQPTAGTDRTISFVLKSGVAVYGGFAGTETLLSQRNPAANATVLSGDLNGDDGPNFANMIDNSYHVVVVDGTANTAILDGFTIKAGNANATYVNHHNQGGGVLILAGSPTLTHLILSKNYGFYGGGIYMGAGNLSLTDVTLNGNKADSGGGIYTSGGNLSLIDVTLSDNNANGGGGIYTTDSSTSTFTKVTLSGNTAVYNGGGLYSWGRTTLTNVTFHGNTAQYGGGMATIGSLASSTLTNATFFNNTARMITTTSYGGGIYNASSTLILRNAILWGNTGNFSQIYNDGSLRASVSNSIVQEGYPGGTNIITADPKLGTFGNHGGSTQTVSLHYDSSAIDTGNDAYCPSTDQRGIARPQGSHCDIGAVEYFHTPLTLYVRSKATGANNGTSWANAYTDLQAALAAAEGGDQIWVAAGTYKPTTGTDATISFVLKNKIAIYGGFAGTETLLTQRRPSDYVTILSGDLNGNDGPNFTYRSDNSYHVVVSSGVDNTAILDGFTIKAGNAIASYPHSAGGGLYNDNGSPTLGNLVFSDNYAQNAGGMYSKSGNPALTNIAFNSNSASYSGGGVHIEGGSPNFTKVTFSGNAANAGAGIYSNLPGNLVLTDVTFSGNIASYEAGGMYNFKGNLSLTNVTFSNNKATTHAGGGLRVIAASATLTNVTFSGNSGNAYGGGLNTVLGNATLVNVTFNGNSSPGSGSAIFNDQSSLTLWNTIVWGNTTAGGAPLYNFYTGTSTISYSVIQGGCPTGSTCSYVFTEDPQLGTLGNHGSSSMQTIPLLFQSSAIDRGYDSLCPAMDQRGVARPQGRRCDIGAYEAVAPVRPGTYDDTDLAWTYIGTWTTNSSKGAYQTTLHQTKDMDSFAEVTFNGERIQLLYVKGPGRGWIDIYIDGERVEMIDANSATLVWQATWTSPLLPRGVHAVRFQMGERGWIDMDAVRVLEPDVLAPGDVTVFTAVPGAVAGSINLSWIAPADDAGNNASGPVTSYLVKYSTSPFTSWNDGTLITNGVPTPAAPGTAQTMTVSGLTPGTLYYFAIRAQDEGSNLSHNYAMVSAMARAGMGPGTYDDTHPAWNYVGSWSSYTTTGPYNGTINYTATVGDYAELTFHGTNFTLIFTQASSRGLIDIYVDGAYVTTLNAYSPSTLWQQTFISPSLLAGNHTVRLVHAGGGTYIDVDAIHILNGPVNPGTYDDTHADWKYIGNWTSYTTSGPYNNTIHYTATVGDYAELMFSGTRFTLTFSKFSNRGLIDIYVDGAYVTTLDAYSPDVLWQQTYTSPTYPPGTHSVRFSYAGGGTYIDVDAITILP